MNQERIEAVAKAIGNALITRESMGVAATRALAAADAYDAEHGIHRVALDGLMSELVAREERWKKAFEAGEMTHDEASSAALEDRWVYSQLAALKGGTAE